MADDGLVLLLWSDLHLGHDFLTEFVHSRTSPDTKVLKLSQMALKKVVNDEKFKLMINN